MATGTIKTGGWKLLWTNANPSTAFAAQTINIDLSKYSEIRVVMKQSISAAVYINFFGYVNSNLYADIIGTFNSAAVMMLNRRELTFNTTGVVVTEGRKKAFNATTYTVDNNEVIPYQIFAR